MIQTYIQLQHQVSTFNESLGENGQIQKIFSSLYVICFVVRVPGKTVYLNIGRGGRVQGLWEGDDNIPSKLRVKDHFLEYLRRFLRSCRITGLGIDEKDRILSINYIHSGKPAKLFLFYKGGKTHFLNSYYDLNTNSYMSFGLHQLEQSECLAEFSAFDELGRANIDKTFREKDDNIQNLSTIFEIEERSLNKIENKKQKFLKRKIKNIESDLIKALSYKELETHINNPETNLAICPSRSELFGIKLKFEQPGHYQRFNQAYIKIKGLKKAEKILGERLQETKDQLDQTNKEKLIQSQRPTAITWPSKRKENTVVSKGNFKIFDKNGFKIAVGLNTAGNDEIRIKWAKKEDFWFHLEGDKSAHVIIKSENGQLSGEMIECAAKLLAEFSGLQGNEVNLIYTLVKNLKGVKGTRGMVIFKKEKHLRIFI